MRKPDRLGSGRAPLFHDLKRRAWTAEARSAYMARTLSGMEYETTAMPAKVKSYQDPHELLAKLESKAAMWERVARDRSEERRVGKGWKCRRRADRPKDGIRDFHVTGVQPCALPISSTISSGGPGPRKHAQHTWRVPSVAWSTRRPRCRRR